MNNVTEIELPEEVTDLLEPVEGDSPAGIDANSVEEYFKLEMEIGKITPDYKICVELASTILEEKSKDLWTASWLCFAWFRIDGMEGLKNGLNLILNLLQKFGENIFPDKITYRSKAVQYINSSRFTKLLEKETINKTNAQSTLDTNEIFTELIKECALRFPDNEPVLKSFEKIINILSETANGLLKQNIDPPNDDIKPVQEDDIIKNTDTENDLEIENKTDEEDSPRSVVIQKPDEKIKETITETVPSPISDKNATAIIRKQLKFFFEETGENKKLKTPEVSFVYSMCRSLAWGKFTLPPSKNNITQIAPPNPVIQNKIVEWFTADNWDVLVPRIELNLLNPDSGFQYWLDIQRYSVKALEQKGGEFTKVCEEIKIALALLLNRFPQLVNLKFKNGETAFADEETLGWINDEVLPILGSKSSDEEAHFLPPIMGEEYTSINEIYKKACKELPKNFEENLSLMQQQMEGEQRRKGRFLLQLNLANLCIEAKQFKLAKVYLDHLKNKIEEYNLEEWEPALCVAVWQSTYIVNIKLAEKADVEKKKNIESEQDLLFTKIAKYDGVLSIKLTSKN